MQGGILAQNHRQRIGRWGENVAAHYLEKKGYRILGCNIRTPRGEIDLVAAVDPTQRKEVVPSAEGVPYAASLVFVEVKTRTNGQFGLPEEAVDSRKLEHMFRSAESYLEQRPELGGQEWRIDVIAIQGRPGAKIEDVVIEHFENISA
jgi:putative endonuclease